MKPLRYLISILCLAAALFAEESTEPLPDFPGSEYKGANRREFRAITAEDMVEGSPLWVIQQVVTCSLGGDLEPLRKIVSPADFEGIRANTPDQVQALFGGFLLDNTVMIGDSKEDGDRYYIYSLFTRSDGRKRGFYTYFLKVDEKWIKVSAPEWRRGKLRPVE